MVKNRCQRKAETGDGMYIVHRAWIMGSTAKVAIVSFITLLTSSNSPKKHCSTAGPSKGSIDEGRAIVKTPNRMDWLIGSFKRNKKFHCIKVHS